MGHLEHEELTGKIIGGGYNLYNEVGPGFTERTYLRGLEVEMRLLQIPFATEVAYPVIHRGVEVGLYRADLVVDEKVIVEVKAAKAITNEHIKQVACYLKAANLNVGLLLNFGPTPTFKRIVR